MKRAERGAPAAKTSGDTPAGDLLGAHVSTAGGVQTAPARAAALSSAWLQLFTKPPRQWADPEFGEAEREAYRTACAEHGIAGTTVHACYLLNCASPDPSLFERSVAGLAAELTRCETIGAAHLVFHPGSATDGDRGSGLGRQANAVVRALRSGAGQTMILLENTSGKGNVLGRDFAELAVMLERIDALAPELTGLVGICLDSCHLFAAGLDVRDRYDEVMERLETRIALERVRCWHLNDSAGALGSTTDRHAHIGEGEIGLEGFRRIVNDPRWAALPMLLETPKTLDAAGPARGKQPRGRQPRGAEDEADRRNLAVLRSLRK